MYKVCNMPSPLYYFVSVAFTVLTKPPSGVAMERGRGPSGWLNSFFIDIFRLWPITSSRTNKSLVDLSNETSDATDPKSCFLIEENVFNCSFRRGASKSVVPLICSRYLANFFSDSTPFFMCFIHICLLVICCRKSR